MGDITTIKVITLAMRVEILGMMREVITHELGNRAGHVDGDRGLYCLL